MRVLFYIKNYSHTANINNITYFDYDSSLELSKIDIYISEKNVQKSCISKAIMVLYV